MVTETDSRPVMPAESRLFASGRDAIRGLIAAGVKSRGWRRWFVPTYFCEEVTASIAATGIEVVRYEDSPLLPAPPPLTKTTEPGDALLLVNYFGLRGADAADAIDIGTADLIEDHTHDPWSRWAFNSRAHYCIASYRKTLPVPGGAAVWSPRHLSLPAQSFLTHERRDALLMKLGAMILKALYLEGQPVRKDTYRDLQVLGEQGINYGEVSGFDPLMQQMLLRLPWEPWRRQRCDNHAILTKALAGLPNIEILEPSANGDLCPFSVVVRLANRELRDSMRAGLIANAIYPAILWPISRQGASEVAEAAYVAERLLFLACDFRYEPEDLLRVATSFRAVYDEICCPKEPS